MASDKDESGSSGGGGQSLSGGASEPLPSTWTRPSQAPRVGRVGAWSSNSSSQSRYVLLLCNRSLFLIEFNNGPRIGRIGGSSPGGNQGRTDSDDDDDKGENLFAGGERRFVSLL